MFLCFLFTYFLNSGQFLWHRVSYFVFLYIIGCCLVVSTSAIDCLERLVSEMTYYMSSGTLNSAHSLCGRYCRWLSDRIHDCRYIDDAIKQLTGSYWLYVIPLFSLFTHSDNSHGSIAFISICVCVCICLHVTQYEWKFYIKIYVSKINICKRMSDKAMNQTREHGNDQSRQTLPTNSKLW